MIVVVLKQKMFRAEDIASEDDQQPNHVYNLLVALKHLSAGKQRNRDVHDSSAAGISAQAVREKTC